ncbi:hypothetical protein POM88_042247 [Heracleum sosnowskyi]|uniref:Uncharacterized protein n=1 Tax=Heracleum sosnowskyi TaxID=360622 RepID=A0AAD8HHL2_9APIA|nr:hypothetical protein POM88_042247 [Heracleum sosnowskyi]
MLGKRPVGGGRRGGASGVEGMRGGTISVGGRRDDGGGSRRDSGSDRRVDEGGSRRDRGADRRVVGGNRSVGRRHGTTGDIGSRRNGAGCGNSSGGGSNNMRSDGRGHMGFDGGASGSHGGSGRSLGGGGASGNVPRGGESVGGGNGNSRADGSSRAGGSSRVGGSIGVNGSNVGGERRGQMYERHLTDEIYDASSEDSDYDDEYHDEDFDDDDEFDDGEFDEDLGGKNDKGDVGSEDESDEGSEDEGDGGSEDEGEAQDVDGGDEGSENDEGETAQHNRRGYSLGLFGQPPPQPHLIRMRDVSVPRMSTVDSRDGGVALGKCSLRTMTLIRNMGQKMMLVRLLIRTCARLCATSENISLRSLRRGGLSLSTGHGITQKLFENLFVSTGNHLNSRKKSDAAKEAREHQKIPHTSGAISFQRRAWDIRDKTGNEPKLYDIFLRWHTKDKENKEFTSQAVRIIVLFLLLLVKSVVDDPLMMSLVLPQADPLFSTLQMILLCKQWTVLLLLLVHIHMSLTWHRSKLICWRSLWRKEQVTCHQTTLSPWGNYEGTCAGDGGKSIARQDEHRSDDDDGGQSPRPGRSRSGERNGIWSRGD